MTASLNKADYKAIKLFGSALLVLGAATFSALAQESDQPVKPVEQAEEAKEKKETAGESAAVEALDAAAKRQAEADKRKKRWYLGALPQLPKQRGPSVGKPATIIPQPFMAPSKLAVELLVGDQVPDSAKAAPVGGGQTEASNVLVGDQQALEAGAELLGAPSLLEESTLSIPDPSLLAVGETALRNSPLLEGNDRPSIIKAFNGFARRPDGKSQSPVFDAFLRDFVKRPLVIPASEDAKEIASLAQARLSLAARLGDTDSYTQLIASFDEERLVPYLGKVRAEHFMLEGDLSSACSLADTQRGTQADPFWIKLAVVCAAASGNRSAVDFELSLLEEVTDLSEVFFALVDRILLEAEAVQAGTRVQSTDLVLTDFDVTPLNVAMARLSQASVESVLFVSDYPLAVVEALKLPRISNEARAALVAAAIAKGQISPSQVVEIYRSGSFDYSFAVQDAPIDDVMADAALGTAALTGVDLSARLDAAARLWQRAQTRGTEVLMAMVLNEGLSDIYADSRFGARLMPLFRIALIAQDDARASNLFRAMRARRKGDDLLADQALILSIPIAVSAGVAEPAALTEARLKDSVDVNGYAKTALLLSIMEGLDIAQVTDTQWAVLEASPRLETRAANPVIWRRFLSAVAREDGLGVLGMMPAVLAVLNDGGADPAFAGSVAAGLSAVGLEPLSERLMREYLFSQGY